MPTAPSNKIQMSLFRSLPWLHFTGAMLFIVLNGVFSAIHSPLGRKISVGESPGFGWIRANITLCVGLGLVYLVMVCWIQFRQMRQSALTGKKLLPILLFLEVFGIAIAATRKARVNPPT